MPVQQTVTPYLEATGNTAAVNTTNLVARVSGFLQEIDYKDGDAVKKGDTLFTIEPEPYKLKLEQAQAAEAGAQATLKQTAGRIRAASRTGRAPGRIQGRARQRAPPTATPRRPSCKQAQVDTKQAAINLGYTAGEGARSTASSPRARSRWASWSAPAAPTQLATIVQTRSDLRELQRQRAGRAAHPRRDAPARHDAGRISRRCRSRSGCRPTRAIRTRACSTTRRRASIRRPARSRCAPSCRTRTGVLLPGYFVRVRVPRRTSRRRRCWFPTVALGSDQGGRYVLVVNKDNVVEQRKVEIGQHGRRAARDRERASSRTIASSSPACCAPIPGQKVDPQLQTCSAAGRCGAK